MKRILFITSDNYPNEGACANILLKVIPFFEKQGFDIEVLPFAALNKNKNLFVKFTDFISKLITKIQKVFKIYYYDYFEYLYFYRKIKKIGSGNFDYFFTISGKFSNTFAVLNVCRKKGIKLITYQVDPLVKNDTFSQRTLKMREKWHKRMIDESYLYICPSYISESKNILNEKNIILELPLVIKNGKTANNTEFSKKVCSFIGSVYGNVRSPEYTIKLFEALNDEDIVVNFVGVGKNYLDCKTINCFDKCDIKTARNVMMSSNFLINIGNNSINFVPSKIFDYISSGLPIINICKFTNDPTIFYLQNYSNSVSLIEENSFDKNLSTLRKFIKENHSSEDKLFVKYYEFTPEYFAKKVTEKILKRN